MLSDYYIFLRSYIITFSSEQNSYLEHWSNSFSKPHFCSLTTGIPLQEISRSPSAFTGRNFRNWLLELRNSHSLIKSSRSALIDRLLEGYDSARHGTGVCVCVFVSVVKYSVYESVVKACYWWDVYSRFQVFGEAEFLEYQQALNELADV